MTQLSHRPSDHSSTQAAELLIAFFGTGAYQAMLSGEGGAHHCLAPEAPKVIVEEQGGALTTRVTGEQRWEDVLGELGYRVRTTSPPSLRRSPSPRRGRGVGG